MYCYSIFTQKHRIALPPAFRIPALLCRTLRQFTYAELPCQGINNILCPLSILQSLEPLQHPSSNTVGQRLPECIFLHPLQIVLQDVASTYGASAHGVSHTGMESSAFGLGAVGSAVEDVGVIEDGVAGCVAG